MKRIAALVGALIFSLLVFAPAVLAADPALPHNGRVLISIQGDVTLPAGEHADAVIVIGGTATVQGEVNTIVAIDGAAILQGARSESVVAVQSRVELGTGTVVTQDIYALESPVTQASGVRFDGVVRDMAAGLAGFGFFLAAAMVLWFIGLAIAAIVAGLVLAALASRQVRQAEAIISHEPVKTFAVGLFGMIGLAILGIVLIATIVGAPIGLSILWGILPVVGMLGFLVIGIWIGEWILTRAEPGRTRERPYLAAVLGLVVMFVLSIIPFISGLVTLFGVGAVLLLAWRTFRGPVEPRVATRAAPVPMPG